VRHASAEGLDFRELQALQHTLRERGADVPQLAAFTAPQKQFVAKRRALSTLLVDSAIAETLGGSL
jgi:hypothetical protein